MPTKERTAIRKQRIAEGKDPNIPHSERKRSPRNKRTNTDKYYWKFVEGEIAPLNYEGTEVAISKGDLDWNEPNIPTAAIIKKDTLEKIREETKWIELLRSMDMYYAALEKRESSHKGCSIEDIETAVMTGKIPERLSAQENHFVRCFLRGTEYAIND